jgi:type II secretory pathway component PulK
VKEGIRMKRFISRDQKGVALIVAIIMLLVLTLIGMSSISSTIFESKISGNDRFGAAAFYASKGGVDVGISRIPDVSAYSGNINSDESYRSGHLTDSSPQPQKSLGLIFRAAYETAWEFKRFQINATGESLGARREIEVQVQLGPYPAGTSYNN